MNLLLIQDTVVRLLIGICSSDHIMSTFIGSRLFELVFIYAALSVLGQEGLLPRINLPVI